jgi:transcriptional regulator with XRE-family HTH domain
MNNQRQLLQIRKKKLGVLIFDARHASRRTVEECAEALGLRAEEYQSIENAEKPPTLPQLELLSLFLNIPMITFGASNLSINQLSKLISLKKSGH